MNEEYIQRINKVLTYIEEHSGEDISLETIAGVGMYSPFHFHRIFKAITQETLHSYITRKRIENAAIMLIHKPDMLIADIAFIQGFKSDAVFSRTFKKIYGQSPRDFRQSNKGNFNKIDKKESKNGQKYYLTEEYLCRITSLLEWIEMNTHITVETVPTMTIVYTTHIGEQGIERAFDRIVQWALPKGILQNPSSKLCRIFHDSFKITDADKVRMSIGIIVQGYSENTGDISTMTMNVGHCIIGRFAIELHDFEKAWSGMFLWMNKNGYRKSTHPPFEIYHNDYREHPEKKCIVDLCIPVE